MMRTENSSVFLKYPRSVNYYIVQGEIKSE